MANGRLPFLLLVGLLALWAGVPSAIEAKGICQLPVQVGPCKAKISRWYYNWKAKRCEQFTYGGCQGNANNFKTLKECQLACGGPLSRAAGGFPKPQGAGLCVEMCKDSGDCGVGEKCLSNGCGHVCMKVTGRP